MFRVSLELQGNPTVTPSLTELSFSLRKTNKQREQAHKGMQPKVPEIKGSETRAVARTVSSA